ncbi:MAG: LysE/ArgO family amino acid transporter [Rubricella sp.]
MVFLSGVGFGLAVAMPVGPIGVLTIRRTLAQGRAAGLATGFGAAAADGVYGVVVASGFALSGLLESYGETMRLVGALILMALGVSSLRGFFAPEAVAPEAPSVSGLLTAFGQTFLLTLTNPATILTFVALIASLGAVVQSSPSAPYWLVLGVVAGSALWWIVLVQVTLLARKRLTRDVTRWIDLASGVILGAFGLFILLAGA